MRGIEKDVRLSCSRVSCSLSNEKNDVAARSRQSQSPFKNVEELTKDSRSRFIICIMIRLQVRMRQRLLNRDPLLRIERQTLLQQVQRERVRVGVERREGLALLEGEGAEVVARAVRGDGVEVVEGGSSEYVEDEGQLVMVCARITSENDEKERDLTHSLDREREACQRASRRGCTLRSRRRWRTCTP